ncbi:hypothetical protein NC653_016004 [Populus alba x Populus x berolinensis]|uniref:Uncharacterized protein n=1 Tax=Populus alba x Populus x berolinensis TaxID=444605 RepID=A0AAD6QLR7_9ROSI|nr:hypothetical protein NC653_016004 [Populus alba x Populus x berolinensis]
MNYSAWSGDSNCVPNWFRSHGRRQQSGPWLDLGRYRRNRPISKGRSGSPAKSPTPPPPGGGRLKRRFRKRQHPLKLLIPFLTKRLRH